MRKYITIILTWNKHIKPLHKEMGENIAQTMPLTETMTETKHPDFGMLQIALLQLHSHFSCSRRCIQNHKVGENVFKVN